jgi:hypothetical protein
VPLPSGSIPVLASLLIGLALAGCGRTGLDAPLTGTGEAGHKLPGAGSAGQPVSVGQAGTGGQGDVAGQGGIVGAAGAGGATGGAAGTCVEGTNTCADPLTGQICIGGVFVPFDCPMGCFDGVCAECVPGSSICVSDQAVEVCSGSGILQPRETCATSCLNGACVANDGGADSGTCVEGTNTCADPLTAQICMGGVFLPFNCAMGCFGGVCAECAPGSSVCASSEAMQVCNASGILLPPETCAGSCLNGACVAGCTEGTTRCASPEAQQTCTGGAWTAAVDCPFVCGDGACGMNVRHVFVTSQTFVGGDLGGLTGADDNCRTLATGAALSSSYAAWLSDDTGSPAARFPQDVGPYVLVDGTVVANNWSDLTSGHLRHPIDLTETGGPPPMANSVCGSDAVWTDTDTNGMVFGTGFSCDDWLNPVGSAATLGSRASTTEWSDGCILGSAPSAPICDGTAPLYCFEQ